MGVQEALADVGPARLLSIEVFATDCKNVMQRLACMPISAPLGRNGYAS